MTVGATETSTTGTDGAAGAAAGTDGATGAEGGAAATGAAGTAAATGAAAGAAGTEGATGAAGDDGLTDDERAALSDPGKRAIERFKEREGAALAQVTALQGQLTAALAEANKGTDAAVQQQLTEATTGRETAERSVLQLTALMRNGLAQPKQGETGEAFATRMTTLAGMLQGGDQAALDNAAAVLAAAITGGAQTQTARVTTADTQAAQLGGGEAGKASMDDALRKMAGR